MNWFDWYLAYAVATLIFQLVVFRIERKKWADESAAFMAIVIALISIAWPLLVLTGVVKLLAGKPANTRTRNIKQ